jgi:hypothetical protein
LGRSQGPQEVRFQPRLARFYYLFSGKLAVSFVERYNNGMEEQEKFEPELEKFLEKHELKHLNSDVFGRIITLIIAALGLIAALAWDQALKHIFDRLMGADTIKGEVLYAIIVTLIAALISVKLGKVYSKRK